MPAPAPSLRIRPVARVFAVFAGAAMNLHPLLRLAAARPQWLAVHLGAYAELLADESADAVAAWRRSLLLGAAAALCALLGLSLAGVALLLLAVQPVGAAPTAAPWLLWAVPAAPLGAALLCGMLARRGAAAAPFALLRQQWQDDAALLRQAEGA